MFKRMLTAVLAVACTLALTPALAEGAAGMPNPMRDVTAEEMFLETGILFAVPPDALDAAYSLINMGSEPGIAQVRYSLGGVEYDCRAQAGGALSDISGMYYEWTTENAVELPNAREAEVRYVDGGAGIILWRNAASGLCFSLSMDSAASEAALVAAAEPIAAAQAGERGAMPYVIVEESWLNVRLDANATTGFEWTYEISDEEMLACDGTGYLQNDNPEGLDGVGGTYVAAFSPTMKGAGSVTLTFRYARAWETGEPLETLVFDLWITEAGTLSVESAE